MKSAVLVLAVIAATRANVFHSIADLTRMTTHAGTKAFKALEKAGESTLAAAIPERADSLKVQRKTVEELVEKEGYPVESHDVITEDGYILTIYRIPRWKTGREPTKVVLLQHGVLASCTDWILFGKKRGLAFILADLGFDVWLANSRGNYYSRKHINLNPDRDPEFWDFSWHEMGVYDIPAMIDYILKVTGERQIYHVGHSQGTTIFYVMTSVRPEYNYKIIHHVSLAPTGFMNHLQSPLIHLFASSTESLGALMKVMGQYEFMAEDSFLNFATDMYCSNTGLNKVICKNALFLMSGFNEKQMRTKEIPIITAYYPAGAATRQLVHFGQEIKSHRFCRYDFGFAKNMRIYMGRLTPPDYELEKIRTNITLIFSENDWMSSPIDVERLQNALFNANVVKIESPLKNCNHLDYLFGKDAPKTIYRLVAKILREN